MNSGEHFAYGSELELLGAPSVALGVLDMILSAHEWVHRRVEQLEIDSSTHALRRVSLDLTVPASHSSRIVWFDGDSHALIPLDVLAKRHLQHFSVSDGYNHPIPTLTRRQNGHVTWQGLVALAVSTLSEIPGQCPDWVQPLLRNIAQGDPTEAACALNELKQRSLVDPIAAKLWEDPGLQTAMQMLEGNFVLIAMTNTAPGTRVILKYEHEISLTSSEDDRRRSAERWSEALGWEPTTLEIPVPSFTDCESFHFEATAPDGIELLDIVLGDESRSDNDTVDPEWTLGYRQLRHESAHRAHLSTSRTADPDAHQQEFREPRVSVRLRVQRDGWLRSSALAATSVALFFFASLHWVRTMDDALPSAICVVDLSGLPRDAQPIGATVSSSPACRSESLISVDPAAFTIALLSVISLAVIRVGKHAFTARMVRPLRTAALVSAMLPIVGAWFLVFPGPGVLLTTGWTILTVISTCLAFGLVLVWRRQAPS